jgi:dihydroxy-acid dehydratase
MGPRWDRRIVVGAPLCLALATTEQSGTSASPSILNASPEAAAGGNLALLKTGDRVRIDLRTREANALVL